jgi:CheY-like chemotaxis protein
MSKVLLVTSEFDPLDALAAMLHERDHKVYTANARRAIELAAQTTFDAVVSEYALDAQLNGLEVIRAWRRTHPDIRAVLMSTIITTELRSAIHAMSNAEIVRKPFNIRQLESAISGSGSGVFPVLGSSANEPRRVVLVVEDHKGLLALCSRLLHGAGYGVCIARNGLEALQVLEAGARPALMLVDLHMPKMSGAEFLATIVNRHEYDQVPVAVMSGKTDPVPESGVDAYLRKPFTNEELLSMVRDLCTKPRRRHDVRSAG